MNRNKIEKKLAKENLIIGIYNTKLEKLNNSNLKKVLDNLEYQCDTKVFINRKPYIVSIDEVDGEVDLDIITLKEYEENFGVWED